MPHALDAHQADGSTLDSGAVYVFVRAGDGNTLAVGAYQEDSNATGIAGNQADDTASASGAVYLY